MAPAGTGNASTRAFGSAGSGAVEDIATRINDGGFSIPTFAGTETDAILQLDLRIGSNGSILQATTALGHDANNNGSIEVAEASSIFGGIDLGSGPNFIIYSPGSGYVQGSYPSGMAVTDWVRAQLVMDLTANGGDGSGSVFAMDLTQGETTFTPVTGLQNINPGLLGGPAPNTWDGMYAEVYGGANGSQLDNITVLVPEPGNLALFGVAGTILFLRRQKK